MTRNILIHGLISGAIISILMLFSMNYLSHCSGQADYTTSMLVGYASMLLAFSLVFVGIRNYRDKYNGGLISFGKALKIGVLIALISSTMYVLSWQIDYFFFMPDFMDKYAARMLERIKASGASPAEIERQTKEMENMARMYKNPFFNAMMTYLEILPLGLVVSLICALILKRKTPKNYNIQQA
jgi:hypothetical protein